MSNLHKNKNVRCIIKIEKKSEENVKLCKVKIEKNVNTKKSRKMKFYNVFTRVFNFLKGRPEFTHVFSHSCLPFIDFFGQLMHFWKSLWAVLIDTL
jgi:hypothetical protein